MNTVTIHNNEAHKEIFTSITQKDFCLIWKKISHDKRIKPSIIEHTFKNMTYKTKEKGWVYPIHHIIYNLIRGLPANRGFTDNSEAYDNSIYFLKHTANFGYGGYVLKPFEDHISADTFKSLLLEIKNLLQ